MPSSRPPCVGGPASSCDSSLGCPTLAVRACPAGGLRVSRAGQEGRPSDRGRHPGGRRCPPACMPRPLRHAATASCGPACSPEPAAVTPPAQRGCAAGRATPLQPPAEGGSGYSAAGTFADSSPCFFLQETKKPDKFCDDRVAIFQVRLPLVPRLLLHEVTAAWLLLSAVGQKSMNQCFPQRKAGAALRHASPTGSAKLPQPLRFRSPAPTVAIAAVAGAAAASACKARSPCLQVQAAQAESVAPATACPARCAHAGGRAGAGPRVLGGALPRWLRRGAVGYVSKPAARRCPLRCRICEHSFGMALPTALWSLRRCAATPRRPPRRAPRSPAAVPACWQERVPGCRLPVVRSCPAVARQQAEPSCRRAAPQVPLHAGQQRGGRVQVA